MPNDDAKGAITHAALLNKLPHIAKGDRLLVQITTARLDLDRDPTMPPMPLKTHGYTIDRTTSKWVKLAIEAYEDVQFGTQRYFEAIAKHDDITVVDIALFDAHGTVVYALQARNPTYCGMNEKVSSLGKTRITKTLYLEVAVDNMTETYTPSNVSW